MGRDGGLPEPTAKESAQRGIELLRQSSWSINQLLHHGDLTEPERVALASLLISVRHGMRFVQAIKDRQRSA